MCYGAGAKEVTLIKDVRGGYWDEIELSAGQSEIIKKTSVDNPGFTILPIKNGISLKEAHISKKLMEADVFINVALLKHHQGTGFTGILKNLMGACPHEPTNRFFHFGSNPLASGWYADVDFLSQCIADLSLVRLPDLSIADSTSFITTNGPFGPGEVKTSDTVTAGTNAVSVDAHGLKYLGKTPKDVAMIGMAAKHGLGEADLSKVTIKEATV
jgi:uncharacterized protein (DUF362 family)